MAIITVRIDDELKKRMEKEGHINWSEVIRRAIISRIEEEELWNSLDRRKLIKAASLNEAMRRRISGWDSVAEIRRWRELAGRGS
jgi:metal-responsive CopG/Arc/MetJ family transcriptional regulator